MGQQIIEEIFDDEGAGNALSMIDFDQRSFDLFSRKKSIITRHDVLQALNPLNQHEDRITVFIRECFDSLFYFLDRIEHFVTIGLTTMAVSESHESNIAFEMECSCGAPNCRKVITEHDWKLPDLQQRYRGYFSQYLQEKIAAENCP